MGGGADIGEEQKRAVSGKAQNVYSVLFCRYLKARRQRERRTRRDLNKTIVPDLITATTGACSPHTPLAELGFHPAPVHPPARTPVAPCPRGCDTGGQTRPSCPCPAGTPWDTLPCLPSTPWPASSAVSDMQSIRGRQVTNLL